MTRYLLETNTISDTMRNTFGRAARRVRAAGDGQVSTSIIVAAELRFGAANSGQRELEVRVEQALAELVVLPFEPPADAIYGTIRAHLKRLGTPIGGNDLLIAAHALATGCTLVTANMREFARVPDLAIENWLSA